MTLLHETTETAAPASPPAALSVHDLLTVADLTLRDIQRLFATTRSLKESPGTYRSALAGRSVALLFEKPSLRTRVTFEVGVAQLGGHGVYLDHQKVRLGERESLRDVAKNLERWVDGVVARTYRNRTVQELAAHADVPVINGLTDLLHPCQALTDLFTLGEHFDSLDGRKLCFVGDGNNTCHSFLLACAKLGLHAVAITPEGYEPNARVMQTAWAIAQASGATLEIENDLEAAAGCSAVYTDTWTSMGQEAETEERATVFAPYQVTPELMSRAAEDAVFLHCLPAHRGAEVHAEVIDGPQSLVYRTAENRLHVQKALLYHLIAGVTDPEA